jgi:hypothetical protein
MPPLPCPTEARLINTYDGLFFWFLDWQFTGSNDELTDPARYQYREAFVLAEAVFEGLPINYCPYIFVDNDAAIARGWAQGFSKKLASVYQTRSFSAPSAAAAPLAKGSRFGASVSRARCNLATKGCPRRPNVNRLSAGRQEYCGSERARTSEDNSTVNSSAYR